MKIGDVVVAKSERNPLRSGCELYSHAIVVSVIPFVLCSQEGDMLWYCMDPNDVVFVCEAHPDDTKEAFKRWAMDSGK